MPTKLVRSRFGAAFIFLFVFVTLMTSTRAVLLLATLSHVDLSPFKLAGVFLTGLLYDTAAAVYAVIPLTLVLLTLPQRWFYHRLAKTLIWALFFFAILLLQFGAVAEWFFWEEFSSRFNFIAVDYLVYTHEVLGNINESYPMPFIFTGLALAGALGTLLLGKTGLLQQWFTSARDDQWTRAGVFCWLGLAAAAHFGLSNNRVPEFGNAYNQELARNGVYSFCAAFWENSLDYERFYPRLPHEEAFALVHKSLAPAADKLATAEITDITHPIRVPGPERRLNVIQVTVESLSAEFLGAFGNTNGLTPVLDRLFSESLVFTNFYATGTRTVRGMEALTLCVPPTPGQSIVRRPRNGNLFSVGSLFQARGYDTVFLYSGYGYFDNMNAFFSANGFRVFDRASAAKSDITHATVWGACDEDLYRWTLREADAAYAEGRPFHHFVMTTSNHRPFEIPAGCIDLPGGTRHAAVKYTDYAIGKLLEAAREKPWFTNTLFVIVGDHCASAAGKTALPIPGYHVPAFVWNPQLVAPRQVGTLCSQIDLLPTVIGLMHWSYDSRFYGKDVLRMPPAEARAFISTYQRLGYFRDGRLAILEPVNRKRVFAINGPDTSATLASDDPAFLDEAIAQYQTASWLFKHGLNRKHHAP